MAVVLEGEREGVDVEGVMEKTEVRRRSFASQQTKTYLPTIALTPTLLHEIRPFHRLFSLFPTVLTPTCRQFIVHRQIIPQLRMFPHQRNLPAPLSFIPALPTLVTSPYSSRTSSGKDPTAEKRSLAFRVPIHPSSVFLPPPPVTHPHSLGA